MRILFALLFFFILTSCSLSQGIQRNYIISHAQKEEIPEEMLEENSEIEKLFLTD